MITPPNVSGEPGQAPFGGEGGVKHLRVEVGPFVLIVLSSKPVTVCGDYHVHILTSLDREVGWETRRRLTPIRCAGPLRAA